MAAITQLSPMATPGQRYSFSAKDAAPISTGRPRGLLLLGVGSVYFRILALLMLIAEAIRGME